MLYAEFNLFLLLLKYSRYLLICAQFLRASATDSQGPQIGFRWKENIAQLNLGLSLAVLAIHTGITVDATGSSGVKI